MRLLVEYSHPAQVHKFKHVFAELVRSGHQVLVLSRDKDVMIPLLDELKVPHICLSRARSGMFRLGLELIRREVLAFWYVCRFKPDVVFSAHSVAIAHVGWLLRKPVVVHDDTEFGNLQKMLYLPFANQIVTTTAYMQDLGRRQIRINSLEPLAYLHPKYFSPDEKVLSKYGLLKSDTYAIVRFVAWNAAHDVGHAPPTKKEREHLLEGLFELGVARVVFTDESQEELEVSAELITPEPSDLHDLMAFATISVGDGITVANEAAVLGIPTVLWNPLRGGHSVELEKFGLLERVDSLELLLEVSARLIEDPTSLDRWAEKRRALLQEKEDFTLRMGQILLEAGGLKAGDDDL
ncbi:MAG: putative glycosyltransferase [Cryomorphaceae bacterium]|jgi:predicted glycosyltransferase